MFELIEGYSPLFDDAESISLKKIRNETIVSLYKEGVGVKKIAYDFGLTPDYVKLMIRRMV
jgi:DNA-binding NarL/FixJ family response regulator